MIVSYISKKCKLSAQNNKNRSLKFQPNKHERTNKIFNYHIKEIKTKGSVWLNLKQDTIVSTKMFC